MEKLNIIIPCYNEEKVLENFYEKLEEVVSLKLTDYRVTMLFVNDGSTDKTQDIIYNLAVEDSMVKFVKLSRNFGKEAAILAGLRFSANADYVCIIDADLQHSPKMIPKMLKAVAKEGFDIAAAKRTNRKGEGLFKSKMAESFYKLINKVSDVKIDNGAQDFRVMNQKVVNAILCMPEYNRFSKGIFSWVGYNTKWFPHENEERAAGDTKWSFWKLLGYAIDGIISFSAAPLRISFFAGLTASIAGFIYALYMIVSTLLHGGMIPGYPSIICAILVMSGLILISLGIVGEYIAKIFLEVKNRPNYVIDETNLIFTYKEVKELAEKPSVHPDSE